MARRASGTQAIDPTKIPVTRVNTVEELSDQSVACGTLGRHVGFGATDPIATPNGEWGEDTNAQNVTWVCSCNRWRTDVIDEDTGKKLTKQAAYGGGELLYAGGRLPQEECRVEFMRRLRERQRAAMKASKTRAAFRSVEGSAGA
jgi:hypothetical protein